jgi:carbamoyltransferase
MPRKILGISAFYHDSAAALAVDGEVVFGVHEERLTRVKHDAAFPANAVRACLERGGSLLPGRRPLKLDDLDALVFYEKPLLKFERLLETHYAFAPRGLSQFLSAMPVWIKEKLLLKKIMLEKLGELGPFDAAKLKLLFPEHHLSHAASAFYPSPFDEAAILTVDGVGEWATGIIGHGAGKDIELLREQRFPHSLGLLYSAFTYYTGFKVNSGEYKLMGLAPYGNPGSDAVKRMRDKIYSALVDVKPDGSIRLNQDYFDYAAGLRMTDDAKWAGLFGLPPRGPEAELTQDYCDMALAIQDVTEDIVLKLAREAKKLTGSRHLCLAGGVALNCVANGKILRENIFDGVWIQPAAGDAGGALGAALAAHHVYFGEARRPSSGGDRMRGSFLGPDYSEAEALAMADGYGAACERLADEELFPRVAALIDGGAVVGWHQGREEWGPRALGNRSILGDARNPEMQKKLNLKIKYRESFRPFAPSVLAEDAGTYFEKGYASPYMLLIDYVAAGRRKPLPAGYHAMPLKEKLYHLRSDVPAITHLDYSARVQTVHADTNPRYHRLIGEFKKRTGYGLIVNTSFNVRGEPIVCTPDDAYRCFMGTEMDYLVIGNLLFDKKLQPADSPLLGRKEYAPD